MDVKTILRIQGCVTLTVPVNRRNLRCGWGAKNTMLVRAYSICMIQSRTQIPQTGVHSRRCMFRRFIFARYEVRLKNAAANKVLEDIANYIKENHPHHSGIIYCLSRKDTEVREMLHGVSYVYLQDIISVGRLSCRLLAWPVLRYAPLHVSILTSVMYPLRTWLWRYRSSLGSRRWRTMRTWMLGIATVHT